MSDPVFLVWRLDFDSLENREPVHRRIIGYATTPEAAGAAAKAEFDLAEKYEGYDRGWGGAKTTYPKFEAEMVQPIGAPTPEQREAPSELENPADLCTKCGERCDPPCWTG